MQENVKEEVEEKQEEPVKEPEPVKESEPVQETVKKEEKTETVTETKEVSKIGMDGFMDVVRKYTKENYVVLFDYEENTNEYGEDFIYTGIKTKSPIDGKNVTGKAEAKYSNGELVFLKILNYEYVNKL